MSTKYDLLLPEVIQLIEVLLVRQYHSRTGSGHITDSTRGAAVAAIVNNLSNSGKVTSATVAGRTVWRVDGQDIERAIAGFLNTWKLPIKLDTDWADKQAAMIEQIYKMRGE